MPSVNVPGVGKVNFPDSMSQADIINAIERDILPNVKKEAAPPPVDAGFSLKDTALALSQGVVGSVKSIADAFGAENVVSSQLGAVQKTLGEAYTPERKAEMARREKLQQQAAKTGKDEISTFLAGVAEAPVQALAQGLGSIVPYVGTGIIGAIGKLTAPTVRAVNTIVGAVQGAGAVKGSLYDNVKNELVKSGTSEQEADRQARQAQEYLGANFLDIMGGVALGGAAARIGVENLLTPGAAAKLNASLLPRMGKAALAEAPLEGAQAGQEQLAINRALQKQGFEVGTFEGVLGAAARDAAVGALVGSTVGAVRGPDAPTKTISDETKSKELKDQEAAFQNLPPPPPTMSDADLQSLLNPVTNESGELLQKDIAPPPAPPVKADETFDMPTSDEKTKQIADLEAEINVRQLKLDAKTHPNMPAATIAQARDKKLLEQLKGGAPIATPAVTPTYTDLPSYLAAVDAGLQVKQSDYRKLATEAGITIPVGTKNVDAIAMLKAKLGEQDATQQVDTTTTGDGAQILSGPEAGGPTAGIAADGRPGVVDTTSTVSPIEDGAGAQQPALDLTKYSALPYVDPDTKESTTVNFNKAYVEDGTIYIPGDVGFDYSLDNFSLSERGPAATALEKTLLDKFAGELESQTTEEVDEQALAKEAATELAGKATPPVVTPPAVTPPVVTPPVVTTSAVTPPVVTPLAVTPTKAKTPKAPKEPKAAATTGKKTKAVKAALVTADYLNSKTFYGGESPIAIVNERKANKNNKLDTDPVNVGIINAGHEIAFDAFDTVDVRGGVNPELRAIAEEKNKAQRVKRQQMRKELSGKKDPETDKPYSDKRITALVSNIPLYKAGAPLEFLTKKELTDIYRKYVGKRKFVKEEKTTREAQKQNRDKFVEELNELQKIKLQLVEQRAFTEEVVASTLRKTQTTGADSRKDRVSKTSEELSRELKDIEQKDTETREAAAQQVAQQEVSEEKQLTQELKEFNKAAEKVLPKKQTPKEKTAPAKSKLVTKVENAIVEDDTDAALDAIANEKINDRGTRTIAQSFLKLIKNFGGVTIQFNDLPEGEDGLFDPATNTIALKGKDGVYTGKRPIDETVMHEVGHYLIDHVVDNREAYLNSIKDPAKRKEVENALNRLDNNFRFVKDKLGNKFNIPTMKEFLAEIFGNSEFQIAIANLDPYKTPERVEGFTGPRKQFRKFEGGLLQTIVRNIANALGFSSDLEGVTLKEILDDVFKIVSLPTADIRGTEVSYLKKVGDDLRTDGQIFLKDYKNSAYGVKDEYKPKDLNYIKNLFFTKQGWKRIATALQNERYAIKVWEDTLALAKRIEYDGKDKINNIYGQLTLSVSRAKNIFYDTVQETYEAVNNGVIKLSNELGIDSKDTLDSLHRIMEALHDPERRLVKYILSVPLSTVKDIPQNGVMISAADRRDQIIKILNTRTITEAQAKDLRKQLNDIIFTTDANGNQTPNLKYVTLAGSSPGAKRDSIDPNNEIYNATGLSPAAAAERKNKYDNLDPKIKALIDEIIVNQQKLHKITTGLNQSANYWSQPVSNRVAFYGFNNYVPLKGIDKHSEADEMMDFDGEKLGKELQEVAYGFDGRMSVSDNPILQSLSDAVRAAMRAGRVDLTQAIKNSVNANKFNPKGQGLLEGEVLRNITFEERQDKSVLNALPKDNTIFHYNPDGSIDVIVIRDKAKREAIRRTYTDTNTLTNLANQITSGLGMMHTRYNYNFAPLNFVRDALTNAWTLGAEMGPQEAVRFIGQITNKVVIGNSLRKGMKLAQLYETEDFGKIRELAKKDPIYKEMVEFIEEGGLVSYLQGISLKSTAQQLFKEVGRSGIMTKVDQLNKVIDIWTNMFELSSRSAAYAIAKQNFKARDKTLTEEGARTKAAAYAKNLANFEQVGKYGKEMGAAFMFFRPAATGAVRAIESVAPAFSLFKLDKVVNALPNEGAFAYEQVKGGPRVYKDPQAIAEFKANYHFQSKSATYMITALMGAGAIAYAMALMMADEDDLGRNKVMNDDMNQWSRFWRIYIPGFETPLQLPWGFGNGAFLAAGSQFAGVISGHQSMGKAFQNIVTQISLDSFVPIPVSRMDVTDNPGAWLVDSLTPSMFRPVVEFVMNKNGLGQDIYNDSNRRMGDAYLGGDNIPEIYKLMAANLFKRSDGSIDISPNTLYFLANSYIDGPARVIDSLVNAGYLVAGTKEFKAKTDIPFLGSFIGSVPNVDSREFKKFEKEIIEKQQRLNMTKNDPETYYRILDKDPLAEVVIKIYNKSSGKLNKLRQESNEIRRSQDYTPKEKTLLLKENTLEQNIIKYFLIEDFKAYDIKP